MVGFFLLALLWSLFGELFDNPPTR